MVETVVAIVVLVVVVIAVVAVRFSAWILDFVESHCSQLMAAGRAVVLEEPAA
jgi:hypothetical protein